MKEQTERLRKEPSVAGSRLSFTEDELRGLMTEAIKTTTVAST